MIRQKYWRVPTRKSIEKLSLHLKVEHNESMQDWEWEIADFNRINDYILLYQKPILDDDDRFTLMETMIQAIEDKYRSSKLLPKAWLKISRLLLKNSTNHQKTILYWACNDEYTFPQFGFYISKQMRKVQFKSGLN